MDLKNTVIGIELGSTRIKAAMIDGSFTPIASGSYEWENRLVNGIWTYGYDEIDKGVRGCFQSLKDDVKNKFNLDINTTGAIGISAMMHGYIPFDKNDVPLVGFRTWRNTITGKAADILTKDLEFNIPQRWSIAHLYHAILTGESHLSKLYRVSTLAVYVHYKLTGRFVAGVGEASGMFPINTAGTDYDDAMIDKFNRLTGLDLRSLLPEVLSAGQNAGSLTLNGARYLDPEGLLAPGIPFAPPEGDAGTGMVATNSVAVRTGNVSAGTSDFAMVVLEKPIGVHAEIDIVKTPHGRDVAMVHCNNCTSDINAWVMLFDEFVKELGAKINKRNLYDLLFKKALEGDFDCGGLMHFNYYSGESITHFDEGRPLFIRKPDSKLSLSNFMRSNLMSALATLKIGLDILRKENVKIDKLYGHGGYFKTVGVGQRILSAATEAPVSVMESAGEGGAYGMALLCAFLLWKIGDETLEDFLQYKVFKSCSSHELIANADEINGFRHYIDEYKKAISLERLAVEVY